MKALVVGGAGGIGSSIVEHLAHSGYEVTACGLKPRSLEQVSEDTGARQYIAADVATETGAQRAVEAAAGGGQLHVVVNSVGISPKKDGKKRPFFDISIDDGAASLTSI